MGLGAASNPGPRGQWNGAEPFDGTTDRPGLLCQRGLSFHTGTRSDSNVLTTFFFGTSQSNRQPASQPASHSAFLNRAGSALTFIAPTQKGEELIKVNCVSANKARVSNVRVREEGQGRVVPPGGGFLMQVTKMAVRAIEE
ncbi:hypothetical protein EYR41_001010 [Orbilia oligospora]|uniref:Uncharacterized protein n=1 Tax=Orbilia oligospora TaxID=2813651 RepID=A0A7C8K6R6_ORBOL|nr:hypothetical protein TWF751_001246 [Orbilia oligospora]TGJ73947.1 hypothetical protein EYR41_001010 [Orbilia oligospora]